MLQRVKRCLKIYCMNVTLVSHSSRLDIFSSQKGRTGYCLVECPHRLSDKLLKSGGSAAAQRQAWGGVHYAFPLKSQAIILAFPLLIRRRSCRNTGSVGAHYRAFSAGRNRYFQQKRLFAAFHSNIPPYTHYPTLYPFVHKFIHRSDLHGKFTSVTQTFSLQSPAIKTFPPFRERDLNLCLTPPLIKVEIHVTLYITTPKAKG